MCLKLKKIQIMIQRNKNRYNDKKKMIKMMKNQKKLCKNKWNLKKQKNYLHIFFKIDKVLKERHQLQALF